MQRPRQRLSASCSGSTGRSSAGWTACSRATTARLFYGNGVDFADLREYQPGDDVRYIDWNVTARMDTPYVREYVEDREITAWFLLDLSPSVDFGTVETERLKRTVLIDFVATLARLLTRHGNRVGAIFYGSQVERTIPARGGRIQVLRLVNDLLNAAAASQGAADRPDAAARGRPPARSSAGRSCSSSPTSSARPAGSGRSTCSARGTRSSPSASGTGARSSCRTSGRCSWRTRRPASSSTWTPHDKGFRRRFHEAAERREAALGDAFKRSGVAATSLSTDEDLVGRSSAWRACASGAGHIDVVPLAGHAPPAPADPGRDRALPRRDDAGGAPARRVRGVRTAASARRSGPANGRGRRRRRLPAALFVAGLTIMVVAMARPQAVVSLPRLEGTVILAFDVSGSMAATDLAPTRMEAAKAAATAFVEHQPRGVDRGRGVQRRRLLGPGADQRPGDGDRRDQPARAAAGHLPRAGDPGVTQHDRGAPRRPRTRATTRTVPRPDRQPAPVPTGSHGSAVICC